MSEAALTLRLSTSLAARDIVKDVCNSCRYILD